jgi:hypothetical protein
MLLTIVMQHTIQVNDAPVYIQAGSQASIITNGGQKPVVIVPPNADTVTVTKDK